MGRVAGGSPPPKKWGATQTFWAAREIWAKPVFKEVSMFFYYLEEIDIFYFILKLARLFLSNSCTRHWLPSM